MVCFGVFYTLKSPVLWRSKIAFTYCRLKVKFFNSLMTRIFTNKK